jgi:adenylate cyclase
VLCCFCYLRLRSLQHGVNGHLSGKRGEISDCRFLGLQRPPRRRRSSNALIRIGIGLHPGEVFYGNVGAADRLDFTAIGPAVNLACRLEGLTKRMGRPMILSKDFAGFCDRTLLSLGFQPVKGLGEPEEVFALAEGPAA